MKIKNILNEDTENIFNEKTDIEYIGILTKIFVNNFGSKEFLKDYGVKYTYIGGYMADKNFNVDMMISFIKNGFYVFYKLEELDKIKQKNS